jgi:hypothetical protein
VAPSAVSENVALATSVPVVLDVILIVALIDPMGPVMVPVFFDVHDSDSFVTLTVQFHVGAVTATVYFSPLGRTMTNFGAW